MNKPDWKDAPEWAQWLAQDEDGTWWWYENAPKVILSRTWFDSGRARKVSDNYSENWRESLEQRPAVQP